LPHLTSASVFRLQGREGDPTQSKVAGSPRAEYRWGEIYREDLGTCSRSPSSVQ